MGTSKCSRMRMKIMINDTCFSIVFNSMLEGRLCKHVNFQKLCQFNIVEMLKQACSSFTQNKHELICLEIAELFKLKSELEATSQIDESREFIFSSDRHPAREISFNVGY